MRLTDHIVLSYFGSAQTPDLIYVGLGQGGGELAPTTGYQRQPVARGNWAIDGNTAITAVTFGPFTTPVSVNSVFLFIEGERVETLLLEGDIRLLPGMDFKHEVRVVLGDAT